MEIILKEMREAISRADHIIRGLVDFSREHQLALELVDLGPLVEHALLLVRHDVTRGSIRLACDISENLPQLKLDSAKFEQVLVNLFINAIHAMDGVENPCLSVSVRADKLGEVPRDQALERRTICGVVTKW